MHLQRALVLEIHVEVVRCVKPMDTIIDVVVQMVDMDQTVQVT